MKSNSIRAAIRCFRNLRCLAFLIQSAAGTAPLFAGVPAITSVYSHGDFVICGNAEGRLECWSVSNKARRWECRPHTGPVFGIYGCPDCDSVFSISEPLDEKSRIIESALNDGAERSSQMIGLAAYDCLVVPKHRLLVAGYRGEHGVLGTVSRASEPEIREIQLTSSVSALIKHEDSRTLAVTQFSDVIAIPGTQQDQPEVLIRGDGKGGRPQACARVDDKQLWLIGCSDGEIDVVDLERKAMLTHKSVGDPPGIRALACIGRRFVCVLEKSIILGQIEDDKIQVLKEQRSAAPVNAAFIDEPAMRIVVGTANGTVSIVPIERSDAGIKLKDSIVVKNP